MQRLDLTPNRCINLHRHSLTIRTATALILQSYGYRVSAVVTPVVTTGKIGGLAMTAIHSSGTTTYSVDSAGGITP